MQSEFLVAVTGLVFAVALLDAAGSDVRRFRIPDRVPLLLLAGFAPAAWAMGLTADQALSHLGAAAVVFAMALGLFALRMWGGGDTKLLPAVALWTGFAPLPRLLVMIALAGGLLALAVLLARRAGVAKYASGNVPYGVAIAVGGLDWWVATVWPRLAG